MAYNQIPDEISKIVQSVLEGLQNHNEIPQGILDNFLKSDVYSALLKHIDDTVSEEIDLHILEEPPKDRLFEILMIRFDVLNTHRQAYQTVFYDILKDPALLRRALPQFHRSMELMLRLADLNGRDGTGVLPSGILPLRASALALVYLNAVRVWLFDDSPDMAATMAELDKGLSKIDHLASKGVIQSILSRFG